MNCKRHEELIRKRQIIQQNKEQLEQAITVLDVERQKDVKRTIGQVDKHFNDISELPKHRMLEIRRFFEDYKRNEHKEVKVDEFLGAEAARKTIQEAQKLYAENFLPKRGRA
jgi:hypothetical protein